MRDSVRDRSGSLQMPSRSPLISHGPWIAGPVAIPISHAKTYVTNERDSSCTMKR